MKTRLKLILLRLGLIPHTLVYLLVLALLLIGATLYTMFLAFPAWLWTGHVDGWWPGVDLSMFDKYPNMVKKLEREAY